MSIFDHIDKKAFIAGIVVILLAVGFLFYLLGDTQESSSAVTEIAVSPLEGELGRELLMLLAKLKSTKLDASVFTDPIFKSLRDFGVDIAPQPVGRRNPFAEFGVGAGGSGNKNAAAAAKSSPLKSGTKITPPPPAEPTDEFSF